MKTIKLWFTDFYPGFEPKDNYFLDLLSESYKIELNKASPDYLIYSCYGREFLNYDCVRIFYTGENLKPDFNLCDYAIGFDYIQFEDRYLRYPNFAFYYGQFEQLTKVPKISLQDIHAENYFCNFIYSNSNADPTRDNFFHLLSAYRPVSSPGTHLNNISIPVGERFASDWMFTKIDFQSQCKFSIAFENSYSPGYTTEKIMHAFISNTIPIYWGNPDVAKDFNPAAFINCHDYESFDEVILKVKEIDQNEELYLSMINEPAFKNNAIPDNLKSKKLLEFLQQIFNKDKTNVGKRPLHGAAKNYEKNLKDLLLTKKKYLKIRKFYSFLLPSKEKS